MVLFLVAFPVLRTISRRGIVFRNGLFACLRAWLTRGIVVTVWLETRCRIVSVCLWNHSDVRSSSYTHGLKAYRVHTNECHRSHGAVNCAFWGQQALLAKCQSMGLIPVVYHVELRMPYWFVYKHICINKELQW